MSIATGKFRQRVIVQRKKKVKVPTGYEVQWVPIGNRWASITLISKSGMFQYEQTGISNVKYHVNLKTPIDIVLGETRFVWQNKALETVSPPVNQDMQGCVSQVACSEQTVV